MNAGHAPSGDNLLALAGFTPPSLQAGAARVES